MTTRNRVENRAHLIYDFLTENLGKGYTIVELCNQLGIRDGATTRSAIQRARDLAAEQGKHFPPAVPQNGFLYLVTNLAQDAIDPTLHMGRVEAGVRSRKDSGIEFMRRERDSLPPDLKPIVTMQLEVHDATQRALGQIQKAADEMVLQLVNVRRNHREQQQA